MKEEKFTITGMSCAACSAHIEKAVKSLSGTEKVNVNLLQNTMEVSYDEALLSAENIIKAVENEGYGASIFGTKKNKKETENTGESSLKRRLILSLIFFVPLFYVSMGHMWGFWLPTFLLGHESAFNLAITELILTLPIVVINRAYYVSGFKALMRKAPNMDSLIAVGSASSLIYGVIITALIGMAIKSGDIEKAKALMMNLYLESAGMILSLITVGKFLEERSKGKTKDSIEKLINLAPEEATVIRDKKEIVIALADVRVGDTVILRPGARAPVDGVVTEGEAYIDEAVMTGESMPVRKIVGDNVRAATVNKAGFIKLSATKVGEDTAFAKIIHLVEEASSSKAPMARIADKASGVFVPVVMLISLLTFIIWLLVGESLSFAFTSAISVLVISCPCALGLATPVAIMVGMGKGADEGILIKSAETLEALHGVDTVVFDKTGTLSEGKPKVTDVITKEGVSEKELLSIAFSLEHKSEHPLAMAIIDYAEKIKAPKNDATNFFNMPGRGVCAMVNGKKAFAGNALLAKEMNATEAPWEEKAEELAKTGKTPLFIGLDGKISGIIAVGDTLREGAKEAVMRLHHMGIKNVMLTGDNPLVAGAVAKKLGISLVKAEILPEDKEKEVALLQSEGKKVAMVGDGINDAPALVRANIGIAVGAGTDVAIDCADVVLIKNDPCKVAQAIVLSKKVIRNIKQNLFWAFFYNIIGIPIAAGAFYYLWGWQLTPMLAAGAMSLSSVSVVTNALRLGGKKIKKEEEIIKMETTVISIEGMMCEHCEAHVKKALEGVSGVSEVMVSLKDKKATVTSPDWVNKEALVSAVKEAGYEVTEVR